MFILTSVDSGLKGTDESINNCNLLYSLAYTTHISLLKYLQNHCLSCINGKCMGSTVYVVPGVTHAFLGGGYGGACVSVLCEMLASVCV